AKKTVPASMLGQLPYYPGYEWKIVGDNLVLIALSTAVVTAIMNNAIMPPAKKRYFSEKNVAQSGALSCFAHLTS
ncbi:hypothetical protein MJI69_30775, partial [Salmonella enterica subsp. enterica serovar Anatum]|nr:hypothetical protein [Salmonella enterica subsp. enterica serovar Anatum]